MLDWKARIGALYHQNKVRLEQWDPDRPLEQQSETFNAHHQTTREILKAMREDAERLSTQDDEPLYEEARSLPRGAARTQQRKVCQSLLNHWEGLILFVENPHVPLDNNLAENTLRGPVTGRKNYHGSGSLWSAELATFVFPTLKTLGLWGINPHYWMSAYLGDCAENGGKAPADITPYLPWEMSEARRNELARPPPSRLLPRMPVPKPLLDYQATSAILMNRAGMGGVLSTSPSN